MPVRLRAVLLPLLVIVAAFALGGCEEEGEDELTDGGVLLIDDDRASGGLPMTIFIRLGTEPPGTVIINAGQSLIIDLAQGSYTVTFDDDGISGIGTGSTDTQKTNVLIQTDKITNIEYKAKGDAFVSPPALQANG